MWLLLAICAGVALLDISPEMARQLAAVVKHHYWEEVDDELNEALKEVPPGLPR